MYRFDVFIFIVIRLSFQVYHDRCFRCRICKRNLTGFSLNEDGDDIYCASKRISFLSNESMQLNCCLFQRDCYRRKQRGDCDSLDFHKAAAEKAQYVHYRNHFELEKSLPTSSRAHSFREVSRHPSLSLRHLERQVLSHQPATNSEVGVSSSVSNRTDFVLLCRHPMKRI